MGDKKISILIFLLTPLTIFWLCFLLVTLFLHCQGTWYLMLFFYLNSQSYLIFILYWNDYKSLPVLLSASPSIARLFISIISIHFFQERFIGAIFPEFMYKRGVSCTYFPQTLFILILYLLFLSKLYFWLPPPLPSGSEVDCFGSAPLVSVRFVSVPLHFVAVGSLPVLYLKAELVDISVKVQIVNILCCVGCLVIVRGIQLHHIVK